MEPYANLALMLLAPYKDTSPRGTEPMFEVADDIARFILANPQAHIDALVKAGVLYVASSAMLGSFNGEPINTPKTYAVVAPHVHEWRVTGLNNLAADALTVVCSGCADVSTVPNRLPIEVPDA